MQSPDIKPTATRGRKTLTLTALALLALVAASGVIIKMQRSARLKPAALATVDNTFPVTVTQARLAPPTDELTLPGTAQAAEEVALHARTSGYLKRWAADIGQKVEAGQVLAEIDAPEVDAQLASARARANMARERAKIAQIKLQRIGELSAKEFVSKLETEERTATAAETRAELAAAEAEAQRLAHVQEFQKVVAPFPGVVTVRNYDLGALITEGRGSRELFVLSRQDTLKVFVSVPQTYVRGIQPGIPATVLAAEYEGRHFAGKVVRTAGALDATTRTLKVEVDVPNPDGALLPGMFVRVRITLPKPKAELMVPANTLVFRSEGPSIVVVDENSKARFRPVKLGRDFGTNVEVLSGVSEQDRLVSNPPDALRDGDSLSLIQPTSDGKPRRGAEARD